jgi:hypothetical protein
MGGGGSASCVAGCGGARRRLGKRWSQRVGEEERGGDVVVPAAAHLAGSGSDAATYRGGKTSFLSKLCNYLLILNKTMC